VDERAGGRRYGLLVIEVGRKPSFEDVERLVVLPMDVQRRAFASGSDLLDERENLPPVCSALALRLQRLPKPQNALPSSELSAYGVGLVSISILPLICDPY
jgi:hypothetical protein